MPSRVAVGVALSLLLVPPGGGAAQEVLTQEEALRMAFPPPAEVQRRTAFLEEPGMERAEELAAPAVKVEEPIVTYYVGREDGRPLGVAYFDAHRVRTLPEVLMVVVTPGGEVARVEVLKFNEPQEYRPPEGWLEEFEGKDLSRRISTSGSIINITGATLTSRAVSRAVRKVLALHRVIDPLGEGTGGSEPARAGEGGAGDATARDVGPRPRTTDGAGRREGPSPTRGAVPPGRSVDYGSPEGNRR